MIRVRTVYYTLISFLRTLVFEVCAPGGTDFYNSPDENNPGEVISQENAPVLYKEMAGYFVLTAKARPTFKTLFDAAGLMLYQSQRLWMKVAYEVTALGIHRLLSVISNPYNDDANHPILDVDSVWLKMAQKGNTIGVYYSLDGKTYDMMRVSDIPFLNETIKVGLEVQCSTGQGVTHHFSDIQLESESVDDIFLTFISLTAIIHIIKFCTFQCSHPPGILPEAIIPKTKLFFHNKFSELDLSNSIAN